MYKIVFFDIDGTLLNSQHEIPPSTRDAIAELKARGVEPVIATGRPAYHMAHIAQGAGIESYITTNGGVIVYKGEVIYESPLSKADISRTVELAQKRSHPLVFCGLEESYATVKDSPVVKDVFTFFGWKFPQVDPDYFQDHAVYQIQLFCEKSDVSSYEQALPNVHLYEWGITGRGFDVIPKQNTKASAICHLIQRLGIAVEDTVAFGDALNDLEMIQTVGMGVAMGNAKELLKQHANYVTKHVDEDGIYYGLKHIGLI